MHKSVLGFSWQTLRDINLCLALVNTTVQQNFIYLVENTSNSFTQDLRPEKAFPIKEKSVCSLKFMHQRLPSCFHSRIIKLQRLVFNLTNSD